MENELSESEILMIESERHQEDLKRAMSRLDHDLKCEHWRSAEMNASDVANFARRIKKAACEIQTIKETEDYRRREAEREKNQERLS